MSKAAIIKKLPAICVVLGLLGVPATAVLASRATIKAKESIESSPTKPVTVIDKAKLTWKYYIPSAIVGGATISFILISYKLQSKELVTLSAATAYAVNRGQKLEEKIEEHYGKDTLEALRKEVVNDLYVPTSVEETKYGDLLCYEGFSGRWFRSSEEAVRRAENMLEAKLSAGDSALLNDFYRFLGIKDSYFGWKMGWPCNPTHEPYIDSLEFINTLLVDGEFDNIPEPVLVIDWSPMDYPVEIYDTML